MYIAGLIYNKNYSRALKVFNKIQKEGDHHNQHWAC